MINGLGRAGPGHACSLMSFLFRQRVNLISFLLQSVIVIELERRHWTDGPITQYTVQDHVRGWWLLLARWLTVQVTSNDRAGDD